MMKNKVLKTIIFVMMLSLIFAMANAECTSNLNNTVFDEQGDVDICAGTHYIDQIILGNNTNLIFNETGTTISGELLNASVFNSQPMVLIAGHNSSIDCKGGNIIGSLYTFIGTYGIEFSPDTYDIDIMNCGIYNNSKGVYDPLVTKDNRYINLTIMETYGQDFFGGGNRSYFENVLTGHNSEIFGLNQTLINVRAEDPNFEEIGFSLGRPNSQEYAWSGTYRDTTYPVDSTIYSVGISNIDGYFNITNIQGLDYFYLNKDYGDFTTDNHFIYNNNISTFYDYLNYTAGEYVTYCVDGVGNIIGNYIGDDEEEGKCYACYVPTDYDEIFESKTMCGGVYTFPSEGIYVSDNNIDLDCNGSTLVGWYNEVEEGTTLINSNNAVNVTVHDCYFNTTKTGIQAFNTEDIHIYNIHSYDVSIDIISGSFDGLLAENIYGKGAVYQYNGNIFTFGNDLVFRNVYNSSTLFAGQYYSDEEYYTASNVSVYDSDMYRIDLHSSNFNISNNFLYNNLNVYSNFVDIQDSYVYGNRMYRIYDYTDYDTENVTWCVDDVGNDIIYAYFGNDTNGGTCYSCVEAWYQDEEVCLTNDTFIITYTDTNACGTYDYLPEDNGTIDTCDYCLISYELVEGECIGGYRQDEYEYLNYEECCALTGITEDCLLPEDPSQVSCLGIHETNDITGLVIDTGVEVGRTWITFAGIIAIVSLFSWLLFVL